MGSFKYWLQYVEGMDSAVRIHLPSVRQQKNFSCGAAALRAVCQYYKVGPEKESEFIKACRSNSKAGTDWHDMIRAARSFGLSVKPVMGMKMKELQSYIDLGRPVIVCMQAWDETPQKEKNYKKLNSGHYVVVIGYDEKYVYFEDPVLEGERGILTYDQFKKRWHDKDSDSKQYHRAGMVIWKPMGYHQPETQVLDKKKKIP